MARNTQGILPTLLYSVSYAILLMQRSHVQYHFSPLRVTFYNITIMLKFFSSVILLNLSTHLPTKIPFHYGVFINMALVWLYGAYSLQ